MRSDSGVIKDKNICRTEYMKRGWGIVIVPHLFLFLIALLTLARGAIAVQWTLAALRLFALDNAPPHTWFAPRVCVCARARAYACRVCVSSCRQPVATTT